MHVVEYLSLLGYLTFLSVDWHPVFFQDDYLSLFILYSDLLIQSDCSWFKNGDVL